MSADCPRLAICIPMKGVVDPYCFVALAGAIMGATQYWIETVGGRADLMVKAHHHDIVEARRELAKAAIDFRSDWILWFDADAAPPPDVLKRLHQHGKEYIVPAFCRAEPARRPAHFVNVNGKMELVDLSPQRLFKIDAAGFHTVLMKTEVFLKVSEAIESDEWFVMTSTRGEDTHFTQLVRHVGYDIWCDSSIQVGHFGVHNYMPEVGGESGQNIETGTSSSLHEMLQLRQDGEVGRSGEEVQEEQERVQKVR